MKYLVYISVGWIFLFSNLLSTTIHVPSQQPSIQAAINTASNFDTVLVDTGLYVENINFNGKSIVVGSNFLTSSDTSYISYTIIDGNQNGNVVRFESGEDSSAILCGFTIRNGQALEGGGIYCINSEPFLKNLIIRTNQVYNDGGGIAFFSSSPNIKNLLIEDNTANVGGGIYIAESIVSLNSVTIRNNFAFNQGGGLQAHFSDLFVDSCNFLNNECQIGYGGGLYFLNDAESMFINDTFRIKITNTNFIGNSSVAGSGAGFGKTLTDSTIINIEVDKCEFIDNLAHNSCGIMIWGNFINFLVSNSKFFNNESSEYAAGGGFSRNCKGQVINSLFAYNSAATGGGYWNSGGISVWSEANVDFINCNFNDNTAAYGAGLTVGGGGTATITNCLLCKNNYQQIALDSYNNNGGTITINYCNLQNGMDSIYVADTSCTLNWGSGNIDSRPLFLSPLNYDYHLSDYSPCIGTGTSSGAPVTDIEGNQRPNPPGSNPDIGAYENILGTPLQGPNIITLMDTLNFVQTFVGFTDTLNLAVRNLGNSILDITNITANPVEFSVSPTTASIDPGRVAIFSVSFSPISIGNYSGILTLTSNDPDSGNYQITLLGQGVESPIISVVPDSLSANLAAGDTTVQILHIYNSGGSELNLNVAKTGSANNYALQFDGMDDYVEIPQAAFNNLPQGSVECWLNIFTYDREILYKETYNGETISGLRINADGSIEGSHQNFWSNDDVVSNSILTLNQWYHVAWTWNGSFQKLYILGELDTTQSCSDSVADDLGVWVRWGRGDANFDGIIDDIRIWNIELSQFQIQENMYLEITGNEPGLIGYWPLNEGAGINTADLTSNGYHGILDGTPTWIGSTAPILNWLAVYPSEGTLAANDSLEINVIFDARNLNEGFYEQNILITTNDPNNPQISIPVSLNVTSSGLNNPFDQFPKNFILYQNYPNPFNSITHIRFGLPKVSDVKIELFNILGQRIINLLDERKSAGYHRIEFEANRFASGVYIYRIEACGITGKRFVKRKKMILMK